MVKERETCQSVRKRASSWKGWKAQSGDKRATATCDQDACNGFGYDIGQEAQSVAKNNLS